MKTAILCPGPSLALTYPGDFEERVIAVNRAAIRFQCDIWAAGDWDMYEQTQFAVLGRPGLLCPASTIRKSKANGIPWRGHLIEYESLYGRAAMLDDWQWNTLTVAITYAAKTALCENPEIELFGADWQGEADFDGVTELAPGKKFRRSNSRWHDEMVKVSELCHRLHVKLTRHLPN